MPAKAKKKTIKGVSFNADGGGRQAIMKSDFHSPSAFYSERKALKSKKRYKAKDLYR